jgi:hypothetical protein
MSDLGVALGANAKTVGFVRGWIGIQTPHGGSVTKRAHGLLIGTDKEFGTPFAPIPTIVGLVIAAFN